MMQQGLVLMVAGMGIVFAYLYLMVIVMRLIGRFVPRFAYLMPDPVAVRPQQRTTAPATAGDERATVAVAVAAVIQRMRG